MLSRTLTFRHQNIYHFTDNEGKRVRPEFSNAEEGDAAMIERWNSVVKSQDHVWHLGDFCMANGQHWIDIGKRLNGHKRIVPGNHDTCNIETYKAAGFQKLQGAKEMQVAGLRLLCSHYPLHVSSLFKRDANIHGHIHEKESPSSMIGEDGKVKSWFNVSVERIAYTPIHIEEVAKIIKEKISNV